MKFSKLFITLGVLLVSISSYALEPSENNSCSLCQPQVIQNQKIFENDFAYVLYDYKPVIQGHCLIVPKRHVSYFNELAEIELSHIHQAIANLYESAKKTYNASSYILLQKNGVSAGQSVPHVHFHFFPRKENDYTDLGLLARFYLSKFFGPISQSNIDAERQMIAENLTQEVWVRAQ